MTMLQATYWVLLVIAWAVPWVVPWVLPRVQRLGSTFKNLRGISEYPSNM